MSKILVTGGLGFIGSHLVDRLVDEGHEVTVFDNLSGGDRTNENPNAFYDILDISQSTVVDYHFDANRFDYVYHLAAYAAEGLSPFIRNYNYNNNLIGSINLINASIKYKVKHFIFMSSIAVYGEAQMIEAAHPQPIDPYGISKYAVELDLKAAHEQFGLDYTIFRPHNVYGPRQNIADMYRNVVGIFIRNKIAGLPSVIFGKGMQTRSFTYIDDIIPVIAQAHENEKMKNEIFNIGADTQYTVNELAAALKLDNIVYEPKRHEVQITHPIHSKLRSIINYPETDLEVGVEKMLQWAIETYGNQVPETKKFTNIEIERGLPPSWTR